MFFFFRPTGSCAGVLASVAVFSLCFPAAAGTAPPNLSNYGYNSSWTSDDGWFLSPQNGSSLEDYPGTIFPDVASVERCAELCSSQDVEHPGGAWNSENKDCFCEQQLICLEPCLGGKETPGITFSTQPRSNFGYCEKSYCEYFAEEEEGWCTDVGFDPNVCVEKKLLHYGYEHSWTSDDGWFSSPPSEGSSLEDFAGSIFSDVASVESCAELCSSLDVEHPGGAWNSENKDCFCEQQLVCLEPCLGEKETPGITFSTQPKSNFGYCEKSYCEYFAEEERDWCADVGFDLDACFEKKITNYGYGYSWTSKDGWFLSPPSEGASLEDYAGTIFSDVASVERCAELCSSLDVEHPGGAWNSENKDCFCEQQLVCLEPCLGEEETPGITFSTQPRSNFGYCEKSYCEYFAEEERDWCTDVGFDLNACFEKKLSHYGYGYSWTSNDSWFLSPPSGESSLEDYAGTIFSDVASVERCAELCSSLDVQHPGGAWNSEDKDCFCEQQLVCLEPCLGERETPGITFSTQPRTNFGYCEKSYCEYFSEEVGDWCADVGFEQNECEEKKAKRNGSLESPDMDTDSLDSFDPSKRSAADKLGVGSVLPFLCLLLWVQ